jgi:hypothetical protein
MIHVYLFYAAKVLLTETFQVIVMNMEIHDNTKKMHTNIVVLYKLAMRIMGGRKDIIMKTTTLKKPSFSKEKNEQKIKCCPFQLLCGIHIFSTEIRISAPINENHK